MNDYLDQINVKGVLYTISGGAGSGVTPAEVQEMINQSISGMSGDTQIISGDVIELSQDVQNISGDVIVLSGDVSALESNLSGKTDTSAFTAHTSDATIHLTSGDVAAQMSAYTYDRQTIDDKIISGGTFDPTQYYRKIETSGATELSAEFDKYYEKTETSGKTELADEFDKYYKKTETSSKTEIDDALLIDAYEDYRTKNTYTDAFPSLTGTADWNTAIQSGIFVKNTVYGSFSSSMLFKLQVIDENGNTFSAQTEAYSMYITPDRVNPLPDYIDIVEAKYADGSNMLREWVFQPKDGYRISYAQIDNYWDDIFGNHNNINEIEWYDVYPSGYTKDIIEDVIEPIVANAQPKLSFKGEGSYSNIQLITTGGKLEPYVPTDNSISQWNSGSTNPVQTQAVYNYTYSKAQIDEKIASGGGITSGDVVDIVSGYTYSKDEIDDNEQVVARALNDLNDKKVESGDVVDIVSGYTYDKDEIDGKISDASTDILAVIPSIVSADTEDIKQDVAQLQLSAVTNAQYDSTNKVINFYNLTGGTVASVDATDFIKDGMIEDVEIVTSGGTTYLKITFNTDAGLEEIDLNLSQVFDANNYYTKTEVNNIISNKIQCLSEAEWAQTSGSTQSDVLYLIY